MKTALALGFVMVATFGVACKGTLPPGGDPPRPSPEGSPSLHTNDAPTAGPLADDQLASPPDTLPGPTNPAGIAEPTDKGTITTTTGGTSAGGTSGSGNH
jgi:hypothetical protein